MALVFPRDMITGRGWTTTRLDLLHMQELSRTAGGRVTAQDLGPPIWRAVEFTSRALLFADADALIADFQTLRGSINSFYAYDLMRKYPVNYDGEDLSAVTIGAVSSDRTRITLNGRNGMAMAVGDLVSVQTSIGGRELFRVGYVDGTWFTVSPHVRVSVSAGDTVDLIKPFVELRLDPGGLSDPYASMVSRRVSFTATQVIR